MKHTSNIFEIRNFQAGRHIATIATMLFALTLAGAPRVWAQECDPSTMLNPSLTLSASSLISGSGQTATGTVTVSNIGSGGGAILITNSAGGYLGVSNLNESGDLVIPPGENTGTFQISARTEIASATPLTYTVAATYSACRSAQSLTLTPNYPSLTLSPSSVIGGGAQLVTARATLSANVASSSYGCLGVTSVLTFSGPASAPCPSFDLPILGGGNSVTFTLYPYAVTTPQTVNVKVGAPGGVPYAVAHLKILPASAAQTNPETNGPQPGTAEVALG